MYYLCFLIISLAMKYSLEELVVSDKKMNWTEAVQFCTERNSTLIHKVTTEQLHKSDYWTAKQQRISPWIHIMGCFNETVLHWTLMKNVSLSSDSVVLCQQQCSSYRFFGLQNSKCACLRDDFSVNETVTPKLCDETCSSKPSTVLNECGGSGTYSIYGAGYLLLFDKGSSDETCLAIKCPIENTEKPFIRLKCSTPSYRCICKNLGEDWPGFQWTRCLKECKSRGYYMYSDFDVYKPQEVCDGKSMSSLTGLVWVGIAKKTFFTLSLESIQSYSLLLQCESCNQKQQCTLHSCSDENYALCYMDQPYHTREHIGSSWTTPTTETTKRLSSMSQPPVEAPHFSEDSKSYVTVTVIVITLVAVSILVVAILTYIRKRSKKHVSENKCKQGVTEFKLDNAPEADSKSSPSITSKNTSFTKEPEMDRKEDYYYHDEYGYNHLWELGREKIESNTYMEMGNFNEKQCCSENQVYNHLREEMPDMTDNIYSHTSQENDYDSAEIENSTKLDNYDHWNFPTA